MKKLLICLLAVMMCCSAALAETTTLEGTVVASQSIAVLAPAAGTVSQVLVQPGARVAAGQEVAQLMDQTVYADKAGTVRVFGSVGDGVEALTERYGGVLYLEADQPYTASISTGYAYSSIEMEIIHPGETVYLRCTGYEHEGVAVVTALSGSKFTIEVTEGVFEDGDSVYVFRSPDYDSTTRLGKGSISYTDATAYTNTSGAGAITRIHVADGAHVEAGDPLFSTLEVTAGDQQLASAVSGIVASVSVAPGDAVEQGALIATLYPDTAMCLEVLAEEYDLEGVSVGQPVTVSFASGLTLEGQVERFGGVAYVEETDEADTTTDDTSDDEDDTTYFTVYVAFPADETIAYGMTAKVIFGD